MGTLLYRLGGFGARRSRLVLVVWPLLIAAVAVLGLSSGGSFADGSSIPGSPAQAALDEMNAHFPATDDLSAELVVQAPPDTTLTGPAVQDVMRTELQAAGAVSHVSSVSDPFSSGPVSADSRTTVVQFQFDTPDGGTVPAATVSALQHVAAQIRGTGATAVLTGDGFDATAAAVGPTEGLGVLIALAILVITFGSLLSAGMPLLTALVGVAVSAFSVLGLSSVFDVSINAMTLAVMLGLAVGIDYALFIVSRHRSQLAEGMAVEESIATATATAGSAVVFAGATVIIALCGLLVAHVPVLTSMGLSAAGAVAVALLTALTLLPAVLSVAGTRLTPSPASRTVRRTTVAGRTPLGVRWVTAATRRPVITVVASLVGLLVLAAPALQLKTSLTDAGSDSTSSSSRQAYDLVADAFGPGANGPLVVLVTGPDPATVAATATTVDRDLHHMSGIASVSPVDPARDGRAARIQVTPTTGPRSAATSALVGRIDDSLTSTTSSTGSHVAVTGQTAVSIDVATKLSRSLLPFTLVVVGLSLLLLLVAFRSIAVPIKATVGFLLSLAASLGVTVAVFQKGWLAGLIGAPSVGPLASFVPIIVMAVLFGLAMDYEVFLVSSMREEYTRTRDARGSVVGGARTAARVVTAAATIMVSVFVSFLPSHDPDIMPIAFALAAGVLIDAFVVRMTLVPAVLTILGDRAWWLPAWLDRLLPAFDVEGGSLSAHSGSRPAQHVPAGAPPALAGQDVLA